MTDKLTPVRCGCGGEANIYTYEARWKITEDGYQRSVGCLKCGIATQLYDTEAEAVTAWNMAMGITHERAVEYLQSTGWMQDHDYQMMEMGKEMARENFNE